MWNVAALGLLAGLAATSVATAGSLSLPSPNVGPALLLRLEGVREPTAAVARRVGFTVTTLGFTGDDLRIFIGVTDARTVGGDQPVNGKDVLDAVAPYTPNLLVMGAPELVRTLRDSPVGAPVVLEGLVSRGSRTYLLRQVVVGEPASDNRPP